MPNQVGSPLEISSLDVAQLNDRLRQIRDELDYLRGLRGTVTIQAGMLVKGSLEVESNIQNGTDT